MGVEEEGMAEGRKPVLPRSPLWATFHQYLIGSPESPREAGSIPSLNR